MAGLPTGGAGLQPSFNMGSGFKVPKPPRLPAPPRGGTPHQFRGGPVRLRNPNVLHQTTTGGGTPAPGSPPAGGGTPTPTPGGGGGTQTPSPLDATYYQNVADNLFKVNSQVNALNLQGSQDTTALQSALAQLAYQQPRSQLALEQGANRNGSLYSSVYDQNLGNLNYQFAGKQGAAENTYGSQMANLASQIAAAQAGIPIYNEGQYQDAVQRQAALDAADKSLGATPFKPVRPTGAPANAKYGGRTSPGAGWRGIGGGWWVPPRGGRH